MRFNQQFVESLLHKFVSLNVKGHTFFFFVEDIRIPTVDSITGKYKDEKGIAYDTLEDFLPESVCILKLVPEKTKEIGCKLKDLYLNFKVMSDQQIKEAGLDITKAQLVLHENKEQPWLTR